MHAALVGRNWLDLQQRGGGDGWPDLAIHFQLRTHRRVRLNLPLLPGSLGSSFGSIWLRFVAKRMFSVLDAQSGASNVGRGSSQRPTPYFVCLCPCFAMLCYCQFLFVNPCCMPSLCVFRCYTMLTSLFGSMPKSFLHALGLLVICLRWTPG